VFAIGFGLGFELGLLTCIAILRLG
jgi:hypothetical protein